LDQQQALRIRDTVSEVVEDLETRRSPDRSPIGLRLQTSTDKFSQKVAELRNTDPLVDWSGVKSRPEARRLVAF
jgi:hypothetical protein